MLVPALRRALYRSSHLFTNARKFTTYPPLLSQVGREPIVLPPAVKLVQHKPPAGSAREQPPRTLEVVGPLGTSILSIPHFVRLDISEESPTKASLTVQDPEHSHQCSMWGTIRSLLANAVLGVSEGHTAILRLVGVGYRAAVEQEGKIVNLKVGYAHPVELKVPEGVKASTPAPTRILLEGIEKAVVKQFAANIRHWRKPEPYKGKGIFVNDETIKLKAKKVK